MKDNIQSMVIPIGMVLLLVASGCGRQPARDRPAPTPLPQTWAPTTVRYAQGLDIDYRDGFKVVTVKRPWVGAETAFRYLLLPREAPVPAGYEDAQIVRVPVRRLVVMSTTMLPHLVQLGVDDRIVGVDDPKYISSETVRGRVEADEIAAVGEGAAVNIEQALALAPDLVMTGGMGSAEWDAHPKLMAAGFNVAMLGDWQEDTPLARAEWIKYAAAFFNREAAAEARFREIESEYGRLAALTRKVAERPTVFCNVQFRGSWHVPGGQSYMATILRDAGAAYIWADDPHTGGLNRDFETILDRAATADVWINTGIYTSIRELLAANPRYRLFAALQAGEVYNSTRRTTPGGGNDYYESGAANPHLVLADLIHIFHPELLPEHEFYYFEKLPQTREP